jgi:DNA-binding IscR family transcriptional regulator
LQRHNLSRKGLGGGFRLARDSRKITLLDVVEPIEHLSRKPWAAEKFWPKSDNQMRLAIERTQANPELDERKVSTPR